MTLAMRLLNRFAGASVIAGIIQGCSSTVETEPPRVNWRTKEVQTLAFSRGGNAETARDIRYTFAARQVALVSTPEPTIRRLGILQSDDSLRVHVDFDDIAGVENDFLFHTYRVDITADVGNSRLFDARIPVFSSNLPIVIIDTGSGMIEDEPKIPARMGVIRKDIVAVPVTSPALADAVFVSRNFIFDIPEHYYGDIGIELRGQSSQRFCKKSYGIELRDDAGNDEDHPLVGMPSESDWVLHGPYSDKTLLRNHLAYNTWRGIGHPGVRSVLVEVFLSRSALGVIADECEPKQRFFSLRLDNGYFSNTFHYVGVYLLVEKIKRGLNRISITNMTGADNAEPEISGGYLLKIDKDDPGDDWFVSENGTRILYVDPKPDQITSPQKDWIEQYVNDFEAALVGPSFNDPVTGYAQFIDVDSFIDFFLLQEVFKNIDGLRISTFFYKDREGKLIMGPAWDFNLSMKNAYYCGGASPTGWYIDSWCAADPSYPAPFWWRRLLEDPAYKTRLVDRWNELRSGVLDWSELNSFINSAVSQLSEAHSRNYAKWLTIGTVVWPNPTPVPTTYEGELSELRAWIQGRLSWIDQNIASL